MSRTEPLVVVGVDGSPGSRLALDWALDYVTARGGRIRLVCTWHWPAAFDGVPVIPPDWDPEREAEQLLRDIASSLPTSVPPEIVVRPGDAGSVLVEQSRGADLLVVGSRGHGGVAGLLLGSVSSHCVHHAHCPVVVIRSDAGTTNERPRLVAVAGG